MRSRRVLIVLVTILVALAGAKPKKSDEHGHRYTAVVPLGITHFTAPHDPRGMYLMVTAESPAFDGWQVNPGQRMPMNADGAPVRMFPERVDFRVTASSRVTELVGIDEYPMKLTEQSFAEAMTKLNFRLRIFHGIDARVLSPASVNVIGVPEDVPYDERVWRVSFDIGQVPIDDRLVFEVLSAEGERIAKFHLEF